MTQQPAHIVMFVISNINPNLPKTFRIEPQYIKFDMWALNM
jgi:hypothetical protein